MSCNIQYRDGKIINVLDDNGNISKLYTQAVEMFGEEKGLEIYLVSKSDDFLNSFGQNEPTLQEVTKYIAENNKQETELNSDQKTDFINVLLSEPNFKAEDFYDEFGMFVIPKKYYSDFELMSMTNQEQIKQSIDAILNSEFSPTVESFDNLETTNNINSFGKFSVANPNVVEKDIIEAVLEDKIEELPYLNPDLTKAEGYIKAEVLDSELNPVKKTNTEKILPLVVKQTQNTSLERLSQISLQTLQQEQEDTTQALKSIENDLIAEGINIVGLSEKEINQDLVDFLQELNIFVKSPTKENIKRYAEASDKYFERDLSDKIGAIKTEKKDRKYVIVNNTNLTEEEIFDKKGLIKSELLDNIYIQTAKEDLETLYNNLRTYTEKYPKGTTLEQYVQEQISEMNYDNAENAEAIVLYKMYFDVANKTTNDIVNNATKQFTGDYNYLTEEYISDFYADLLKEKQKNSTKYRNFYSNFEINEKGINLKNTDAISLQQVEIYADENLRQYSLLSKQMPDLNVEEQNNNRRDLVVNNPQTLESYKSELYRLDADTIILKDNTEEFIKVNNEIYESVETKDNLNLFARIKTENKDYNSYNTERPTTEINIEDYTHLSTQESLFTKEKKYLNKEEKNQIKNDKFNC